MDTRTMMTKVRAVAVAALLLGLLASGLPAAAQWAGQQPLATGFDGQPLDETIDEVALSHDGSILAFVTAASNVVPGDTNGVRDVFVHDRRTGEVRRASVSSTGVQGDDLSRNVRISADGGRILFDSLATTLVPGDTNGAQDIFVHDRGSAETWRVSVSSGGGQAEYGGHIGEISGDGNVVAFFSHSTNLAPVQPSRIYVRDLSAGVTDSLPLGIFSCGCGLALDHDGRHLAYYTRLTSPPAVSVHDRLTATTEVVNVGRDQAPAAGNPGYQVDISADGRFVAFSWDAPLVPGEFGDTHQVYVRDRLRGTTELVSPANDGPVEPICEGCQKRSFTRPTMSPDGRRVAYTTGGTWSGPGNWIHDRGLLAREPGGPVVSGDGISWMSVGGSIVSRGEPVHVRGVEVLRHPDGMTVLATARVREGSTVAAADVEDGTPPGTDLLGASVAHVPEASELVVRWRIADLPWLGAPPPLPDPGRASDLPGLRYELGLVADGVRYLARASVTAVPGMTPPLGQRPPTSYRYEVLRCNPDCGDPVEVTGRYGVSTDEVRLHLPLEPLGMTRGGTLTSLIATTGRGVGAGLALPADAVALTDLTVTVPTVRFSVAEDGAPVVFGPPTPIADGQVEGWVEGPPPTPPFTAHAQLCWTTCTTDSWEVTA